MRLNKLWGSTLSILMLVAACGDDTAGPGSQKRPPNPGSGGGVPEGGGGAGGGDEVPETCGDGALDVGELCDGRKFVGDATCQTYGFAEGKLECFDDCTPDLSGCSGVEACTNASDDDGDGQVDCGDPDCAEACAGPACDFQVYLPLNVSIAGNTSGHPNEEVCGVFRSTVAYNIEITEDVVLDILLGSDVDVAMSLRQTCADATSEAVCADVALVGEEERLVLPALAGTTWSLLVSAPDGPAFYTIDIEGRVVTCGDGIADLDEQCDDGGAEPSDGSSDGCSLTCTVEVTETEPNDTAVNGTEVGLAPAENATPPFVETFGYAQGQIATLGDVDHHCFDVSVVPATVYAVTAPPEGIESCDEQGADTKITLWAPDGVTALVSASMGEDGVCGALRGGVTEAGRYCVSVEGDSPTPTTFFYNLSLTLQEDDCGDGSLHASELCDDGNADDNDGCDSECQSDADESEPNGEIASADNWHGGTSWLGNIDGPGDEDFVVVEVQNPGSSIILATSDAGSGLCSGGFVDTELVLFAANGELLAEELVPEGQCSALVVGDLAPGTYIVRVSSRSAFDIFRYSLSVTIL